MVDVHDPATRSYNMAAIRGKNTQPEVWLRKAIFRKGFRYRLHRRDLPGTPDIVLPRYRAVIFVHGCFWHGHDGCPMFKLPETRRAFWLDKISSNKARDARHLNELESAGWRVLEVWECALKGKRRLDTDVLVKQVVSWIKSNKGHTEISGHPG